MAHLATWLIRSDIRVELDKHFFKFFHFCFVCTFVRYTFHNNNFPSSRDVSINQCDYLVV